MRKADGNTIVLTGLGAVTALGFGVDATFDALLAGRTGVAPTGDAAPGSGMEQAACVEPPFLRADIPDSLQAHQKFLSGSGELAVEAAQEAVAASGWAAVEVDRGRKGLWSAQTDTSDWSCTEMRAAFETASSGFTESYESEALNLAARRGVKPFFLLESLKNNAFSFIAAWHGLEGANTGVAGFAAGALGLVDLASRSLARHSLDMALFVAGGRAASEVARRDMVMHGMRTAAEDPAYRPLDAAGRGVVLADGAAACALERRADAEARGATIHGALLGYAGASGAPLDGVLAPQADTVRRAAHAALADAGAEAGDVGVVVLPSLGLPAADRALLDALDAVPALQGAARVSWRGGVGLAGLASEAIDVVIAAKGLAAGRFPGTIGCRERIADSVAPEPFDVEAPAALVVAAGLQGEASAIVVARA